MIFLVDLLAATLRNATPLVYGAVGETYAERSGVLNLGIEGTMYAGAFTGFAVAYSTGSLLLGLAAAIVVGLLAGALMALLTVTLGANQHVSGIGLTILLIGLSEFTNRLIFGGTEVQRIDAVPATRGAPGPGPARPALHPIRPDVAGVPGRRPGRLVAPQPVVVRAGDPRRRREPRGGGRGRRARRPGPAISR